MKECLNYQSNSISDQEWSELTSLAKEVQHLIPGVYDNWKNYFWAKVWSDYKNSSQLNAVDKICFNKDGNAYCLNFHNSGKFWMTVRNELYSRINNNKTIYEIKEVKGDFLKPGYFIDKDKAMRWFFAKIYRQLKEDVGL